MRFYRRPAPRVALSGNLATGREVSGLSSPVRGKGTVWVSEGGGHPSSIGDQCEKKFVRGRGEEELLELFEGVFCDGEIDYTNFVY